MRFARIKLIIITVCCLVATAYSLPADTVLLKNGYTLEGKVVSDDGVTVTLKIKDFRIFLKHDEIEAIIESAYTPSAPYYEEEEISVTPNIKPVTPVTTTPVVAPLTATASAISDDGKTPAQVEINNVLRLFFPKAGQAPQNPWQIMPQLVEKGRADVAYLVTLPGIVKDPAFTGWIIYALGQIADESTLSVLKEKLSDAEETVRMQAVEALGHFSVLKSDEESGDEEQRKLRVAIRTKLKSMLAADPSPDVRFRVVNDFSEWGDPSVIPSLISALDDSGAQVRSAATQTLIKFGQLAAIKPDAGFPDLIPVLIDKIKDAKPPAKKEIAAIFGQLKDKRTLETIITLITDKDKDIRSLAVTALNGMIDKDTLNLVTERLKEETDIVVKVQIIQVLGNSRDYSTIPFLIDLLQDADDNVKLAAAQSLRALTNRSFGANYDTWKNWWDTTQGH